MKVVVRRWLAGHASTLLDRWAQVGWNLDRIRYDDLSGAILLRRQLAMGRVVEAGVRPPEHEAPARLSSTALLRAGPGALGMPCRAQPYAQPRTQPERCRWDEPGP